MTKLFRNRPAMSPLLFLPGLIFGGLARLRNSLYALGVFEAKRLPAPVISIGNLTLGGAGKTPLVIRTAQLLRELGAHPAVLSRGYGRGNPRESHILPPGNEIPSPARNLGDEPALVRRKIPEVWLGISADRFAAAGRILERRPGAVFILDDGFQHRRIERDLNILVIDSSQPLARNHILPFGSLREPLSGMRRAQMIIINGGSSASGEEDDLVRIIRRWNSTSRIIRCTQALSGFLPYEKWRKQAEPPAAARFRSAYLVAAIGNPERFLRDMRALGIRIAGTSYFRDHHRVTPREWERCMNEASRLGAEAVVTTEKDAIKIKCRLPAPLTVALQSVELAELDAYREALRQALGAAS